MRNDAHLVLPTAAFDTVAASDSKSGANLHAVSPPQSPEVSPTWSAPSTMAAPLAPSSKQHLALHLIRADVSSSASQDGATERIEDAYGRLNRVQAMLVCLETMKQRNSMVREFIIRC
jgi:hypothetical protein